MKKPSADSTQAQGHDVFISYSRKDKNFVLRLNEELQRRARQAWVDWEGIRPTEEFMRAIYAAIETANTFIFVLTPDSVASVVCRREIEHAAANNKRMVPIVARDVNAEAVPEPLAKLNWIFCRQTDDFSQALDSLISALDTDLDWIRAHTRLLTRAIEWEAKRQNNSFVLRDDDLRDAERWLTEAGTDKERQPTALQTSYIIASRKAASRRQRVTLGAVSFGLVIAIILALFAWAQRNQAREEARISNAGRLAGFGLSYLRDRLPLALLLATEAHRTADTVESRNTLLLGLQTEPSLRTFLHGHSGPVTSVTFSPDGKILASGAADGKVRLWDWGRQRALGPPPQEFRQRSLNDANEVRCLRFAPDGAALAGGTISGNFAVWNIPSGQRAGEEIVFGGTVQSVALSPDRRSVAVSSVVDLSLRDIKTGKADGEPILGLGSSWIPQLGAGTPDCLVFSPDGKTLAFDVREELWLWDVLRHQPIGKMTGHSNWISQLAFTPDGKRIASGDRAGTVRLWDVERREPIGEPITGRFDGVLHLQFRADGKVLFWAGRDGNIHRYDLELGAVTGSVLALGEISSLAISPDSRLCAVGAKDGTVQIWEFNPPPALGTQISERRTWGAAVNQAGALLAVCGEAIDIFDLRARRKLGNIPYWQGVQSLAFIGASNLIALGCQDGSVRLWNAETRQPVGTPLTGHKAGSYIWSIASSADGRLCVSGGSDGVIRFWDPLAQQALGSGLNAHTGGVRCVRFNPAGTLLASAGDDKAVRLWDPRTHQPIGPPFLGHSSSVWSLAFDSKGETLCSGDDNGTALLWSVAKRAQSGAPLARYHSRIASLAFSPDNRTLAIAAFGGTLQLVDVQSRQPLANPLLAESEYASVNAVAFSPDGKTLVAARNNPPGVFLLDATPDDWEKRAARRANRNLTLSEWKRFFGDAPYRRTFAELPAGGRAAE